MKAGLNLRRVDYMHLQVSLEILFTMIVSLLLLATILYMLVVISGRASALANEINASSRMAESSLGNISALCEGCAIGMSQ